MKAKIPLIVIIGATGVGKTELALDCAESLNAEIISADSRLFYRGMDIGTAKPTAEEQRRVPHHLVDIAAPDEVISLGTYRALAGDCIEDITRRGKLALMVGGTGQYIRSITEGWTVPEVEPDPRLRQIIEGILTRNGLDTLTSWLQILDPEYYRMVDKQNHRRIIRALEVILTTGTTLSSQRKKVDPPYDVVLIGLRRERHQLYERIDVRIDQMIAAGFVDEVRSLLSAGYDPSLPSMSAIGYAEIVNYLQGKISLPDAVALIKRRTRVLVRRQNNWFKPDDPAINWIDMEAEPEKRLIELVTSHLEQVMTHAN